MAEVIRRNSRYQSSLLLRRARSAGPCRHPPAFRVLIVRTTRNAAVSRSAERGPPDRQLLRDLGHSTAKKLCRPEIGGWRRNVATLVHVSLAGHSERVAVAVEDVLVGVGAIIPIVQPEIDPMHLVLGRKGHQLDQGVLLVAAAGCAIGEACGYFAGPALLGILEMRGRIHERFERC